MTLPKRDTTTGPARPADERHNKPPHRRAYRKPRLRPLGKVEQTVLSVSPGVFESGSGAGFQEPAP